MFKVFFDKKIVFLIMLATLIISAKSVFADPAIFVSFNSDTTLIGAKAGQKNRMLSIVIENYSGEIQMAEALGFTVAGNLCYLGDINFSGSFKGEPVFFSTSQKLTDQEPDYEVHWSNPSGIFDIPEGKLIIDVYAYIVEDTPNGAQFIFTVPENHLYISRFPILGLPIHGPTITMNGIIGNLVVSMFGDPNPTCVPGEKDVYCGTLGFEANAEDMENREIELFVKGDYQVIDSIKLVNVFDETVLGPFYISVDQIIIREIFWINKGEQEYWRVFADITKYAPVNSAFAINMINARAIGLESCQIVPVYGFPCEGKHITVVPPLTDLPNFYGWIRDLQIGHLIENALIIAIHESTKKRTKALSDSNGYYIITDLEPGIYWLTGFQQSYRINIQPALAKEGEATQVDFWLKPK